MAFTLRWANEADAPAIKQMVRDANLNPLGIHWQRFIVAEDVTCEPPRIVGIGQVKVHGDGSRELASIATALDRQGEGIASAIINTLLGTQAGALYLTCRSHNETFYQRFAFRRVDGPAGLPPYFRRMVRLMNAAIAVGRVFGLKTPGMVMVREGK